MEKIACLTPTYNRYPENGWMLEECVESFLRQDYQNKELLICNDTPGQLLKFSHPQVKIFNLSKRFENVGQKIVFMMEHTDANIFARMDDDDCYLPWHLTQAMKNMGESLEWHPDSHLLFRNGKATLSHNNGNSHVSGIFRREVVSKIGGYPGEPPGREDKIFNELLIQNGIEHKKHFLTKENVSHVYKWYDGGRHLSNRKRNQSRKERWNEIGLLPIQSGEFEINPHWKQNYVKLTKRVKML
ncbi:MAG: glycosyltransferase family 2 protein [Crenarchaeota archaeon]|nr:MAG: glycosyltransferase family 2 protein [Thermoproteota archaeon]